ncbi:MAG: Quinoprotein glucose dehydrogenase [Candidatus Woesebacteria bacterium GW2011_GWA1_37_7]|uniref:Quinoprotein glucose dehydrogenase n=1 Tax=Candidatus Woesebacteria bacterium GW2011_GWA1_37_7 TaxID=1618545 RepID=A0A0G0H5C8_9BACT|nr:MAG: Quinoprotein glucose dehydrogenase [Candidatus Woesebacteria bacterium GW2011_GWA1_37_7]
MRKGFTLILILVLIFILFIALIVFRGLGRTDNTETKESEIGNSVVPQQSEPPKETVEFPLISIFSQGLDTPWAIAFLADGNLLVTERKGTVRLVSKDGVLQDSPVAEISSAKEIGEGGLQGITLHPDFASNGFLYLYYTYACSEGNTLNRVGRMTYKDRSLSNEQIIVDEIPGASNHDGGRIKFGPDKLLYITTGDAQNPSSAQDKGSLSGKILRVTDDGSPAQGNPFGNGVYSYGHRNPQGITWDDNGGLWETEHGPSGLETGNDEFNRIEIGKNYGWPEIRGTQTKPDMITPLIESGRSDTWAPAGLAFANGKFYFAGLRGQSLYQVTVSNGTYNLKTYFKGEYGRLREVILGPDGMLYVTTSNRDGRGNVKPGDDKILRINPEKL